MSISQLGLVIQRLAQYFPTTQVFDADADPPTPTPEEAPVWNTPQEFETRFVEAWHILFAFIAARGTAKVHQEAYKWHKGSREKPWVNIFTYRNPVAKDKQALYVAEEANFFWCHNPTVSFFKGPRLNDGSGQNDTDIFKRLGLQDMESALRTLFERPGTPFRLFVFYAGRDVGNVVQVRWDGCVSKAYMRYCQKYNIVPNVKVNEMEVTDAW
jgi:hypothetical protein